MYKFCLNLNLFNKIDFFKKKVKRKRKAEKWMKYTKQNQNANKNWKRNTKLETEKYELKKNRGIKFSSNVTIMTHDS